MYINADYYQLKKASLIFLIVVVVVVVVEVIVVSTILGARVIVASLDKTVLIGKKILNLLMKADLKYNWTNC
jgi:hypothetical protein